MRKYQIIPNCKSILFHIGIFLIGINTLYAQSLSPAGHIIIPNKNNLAYKVSLQKTAFEINYQQKKFSGNTLFQTAYGFLSCNANYENAPAELFFYSEEASLLQQKTYSQCINLQLSANKQFLAFYNAGVIHTINLKNFSEQKFQGSTLFSIGNNGRLSYVHTNFIYVDGAMITPISALISIKNYNEQWYYISKNGIYVYADETLRKAYTPKQGIVFDVEIVENDWYISTRTKSNLQYQYFLHKLTNFEEEKFIETKTYKRVYANADTPEKIDSKFNNRNNELIKNPMDFFSAESYQAIGNSYNEIQEYSPGSTYLHPGVDLFGEHLENVHSVKAGYVKAVLTTSGDFHWRVAIANNNSSNDSSQGYLYAHLEEPLIPVLVGDTVAEGEVIGQLVDFPVTGFVHCHFARIVDKGATWSGSWWTFDDPLYYMSNFKDTTAPVFEECFSGQKFAFRDAIGDYITSDNVYGEVDIISNVHDLINTFWKVDVHRIGYQIKELSNPMPVITNEYSFDFNMFNDTYFNGPYIQDIINTMYSRDATCFSTGNYDDRFFFHILSNSNGDDTITTADAEQNFNTTLFPNGDYLLRVWAMDAAGNMSTDSMVFTINNFVGINATRKNNFSIHPNPSSGVYHLKNTSGKASVVKVMDVMGKEVKTFTTEGVYDTFDLSELSNGMYLLMFEEGSSLKLIKN
jgi:murein DD-endopeptidase MepM/ murein hydrolase activator NlpD